MNFDDHERIFAWPLRQYTNVVKTIYKVVVLKSIYIQSYFSYVLVWYMQIQLTLVISNSMGPWKKIESTVVRLKRSYEDTGSVVCLTTKGRQLERNFEELKPASHVPILGTNLNIFDVFVAVFFSPLNSLNLVKRLITSRYLFCVNEYVYPFCLCFSPVALSLNFTHHDIFFYMQYCLFTINDVFLLFNKV